MTTTFAPKVGLNLPQWRYLPPPITAMAVGVSLASDLRNNEDRHPEVLQLATKDIINAYNFKYNAWRQHNWTAFALGGTFGAGTDNFISPHRGIRATLAAGCSKTKLILASVELPISIVSMAANQLADRGDGRGFPIRVIGCTPIITLAAAGYTNCVAEDVGKTVTNGSGKTAVLTAYDNTNRKWTLSTIAGGPFSVGDALTITTGTGAGTVELTIAGKIEQKVITANTEGTTTISIWLDSALTFTPQVGDKIEILSGSMGAIAGGAAAAGDLRFYEIASHTLTSASANKPATSSVDSSLFCFDELLVPSNRAPGEGFFNELTASATDPTGLNAYSTFLTDGDLGVGNNEMKGFQLRITSDTTTPSNVGQRRIIASNSPHNQNVTMAAGAYTNCQASDIGKLVTNGAGTNTGYLYAYDNGTRVWDIAPVTGTFTTEDVTIVNGVGAGTINTLTYAIGAGYTLDRALGAITTGVTKFVIEYPNLWITQLSARTVYDCYLESAVGGNSYHCKNLASAWIATAATTRTAGGAGCMFIPQFGIPWDTTYNSTDVANKVHKYGILLSLVGGAVSTMDAITLGAGADYYTPGTSKAITYEKGAIFLPTTGWCGDYAPASDLGRYFYIAAAGPIHYRFDVKTRTVLPWTYGNFTYGTMVVGARVSSIVYCDSSKKITRLIESLVGSYTIDMIVSDY